MSPVEWALVERLTRVDLWLQAASGTAADSLGAALLVMVAGALTIAIAQAAKRILEPAPRPSGRGRRRQRVDAALRLDAPAPTRAPSGGRGPRAPGRRPRRPSPQPIR